MYEARDEHKGGKWLPLIMTLSLQMPAREKNKTILPMQGSTAVLSPFRIPVSYYLEIANHCFLSYTLKRKRRLPTS